MNQLRKPLPNCRAFPCSVIMFACVFGILALTSRGILAGTFVITQDGKPVAVIKIAADASEADKAAASDLQEYLEKMSGAKLKITDKPVPAEKAAILIGQVAEAKALAGKWLTDKHVGYDGFVIRTYNTTWAMTKANTPNRLVLTGRRLGTRYAVFQLLHLLGCRFYAPHADGECIPQQDTLILPEMAKLYKPDFILRGLWQSYIRTKDTYNGAQKDKAAFAEWCVKNGAGGRHIDMGHNFMTMLPPKKYFEKYPEYYALTLGKNGKLVRGGRAAPAVPGAQPGEMQPCLSNPEVQQIFIDRACERFGNGTGGTFSLSPADTGPEGWCQCEKCKAMDGDGGLAQRLVVFANIVASAVEKKSPGNYFPFYVEYYLPGKVVADDGAIRIRCHPSLVPTFVNTYCPIHSPYDASCPRAYTIRWAMSAWDRVSSQIAIRDYNCWSLILPLPATWTIGPRIRFFRDMGAKWYRTEILNRSPDGDLSLYVAARMLWDVDRDPDAIIEEYFQRYFGEVAGEMKAYYKCLNAEYRNVHNNSSTKYAVYITPASIARLRAALAPALARTKTPVVKRRVYREEMALQVYSATVDFWAAVKKWKMDKIQTKAVAEELIVAVEHIEKLMDKAQGMQLMVSKHGSWWQMYNKKWHKTTAEVLQSKP